MQNCNWKYL